MAEGAGQILLDVTRLISLKWTGRQPTGIDRVCLAYLDHFRERSLAVVQHRGLVRTLGRGNTIKLQNMFGLPKAGFRAAFSSFLPRILAEPRPCFGAGAGVYINASHTDFDLPKHFEWVQRHGLKSVYFIHDLIPIRQPEFSRPHAVRRHSGRVSCALENADAIIVSSNTVAHDLQAFAREQGLSLPYVITSHLAGENLKTPPSKAGCLDEPYFVCVGTVETRKNHAFLLDVWANLVANYGDQAPTLFVIGQHGPLSQGCLDRFENDAALSAHVALVNRCDDQRLAELLANAHGLLAPSLSEGFGLPIVEALRLGLPVIASDIPIFREIGQGIPELLDPTDQSAWEQAIMNLAAFAMRRHADFIPRSWEDHFAPLDAWLATTINAGAHELIGNVAS